MAVNKTVLLCVPMVTLGHSKFINFQDACGAENLGIEYIGGALKKLGADVTIVVFSSKHDLIDVVRNVKPCIIGFTSLTYQSPLVAKAILAIKNQFPEIIAVVGGDHASAKPDDFLRAGADFIVKGEGEKAICKIYNNEINKSEKIIECPLIRVNELNNPFPLRIKGWGMKKNLRPVWSTLFEKEGVIYCMITRRGCGRNCDFCNSGEMWKRKIRSRSMESVGKELIGINLLGDACGIGFVDLDFLFPYLLLRRWLIL